jgi:predicted nucleic acid-binding protein
MGVTGQTRLFLDASVLFAGAYSPAGGSGWLIRIALHGFVQARTSTVVLQETERNLVSKAGFEALPVHRRQLENPSIQIVPVPPPPALAQFTPTFFEDDHVVAAAVAAGVDYLITLDRKLIARATLAGVPLRATTPGEFLTVEFVTHPDYERIRRTVE